jgi:membrane protein YdbS with pleckstrin-like domain
MQTSHVDPAAISVWRWQLLVVTLFLAGVVAATLFPYEHSPWASAAAAVALCGLLFTWLWPATYFRHLRYIVDPTGIVIQRGVLWRSHIALPRVRIQHTDVSQGPLQRHYGIGTLRLYTAGSRYTVIELPGLAHDDAIALRDALLAESSASGV